MFNAELLRDLIKQAQGDISLNNFARECKISSSTLSRIINMINSCAPSPSTLQKIAARSNNGVTYDELMKAAGYIDSSEDIQAGGETENHISSVRDEKEIVKIFDDLMSIKEGDPVEIINVNNEVVVRKYNKGCIFCGSSQDISEFKEIIICDECRKTLGEE